MSGCNSSSASDDQPQVLSCPCGLPYKDVRDACIANGFICPTPRGDGSPCGMRLADHPEIVKKPTPVPPAGRSL
jgi:hypothetical protein